MAGCWVMNRAGVIAGLGLLLLLGAAAPAYATVRCEVPQAPRINVNPVSAPIAYDFSLTSAELSSVKSDTVNPYAPGADTTTGGLRHDAPHIKVAVKWGWRHYERSDLVCLWYDEINVDINLSPKIYVARDREFGSPACREAIIEHEKMHVAVDRAVINNYASRIGNALLQAVNQAGAMGPYNRHALEDAQSRLVTHINSVVDSLQLPLTQEMNARQAEVDTLEEYERVNAICRGSRAGRRR